MELFAQIERSIDERIANLEYLNQRLRYNKQVLSKTIKDKANFQTIIESTNVVEQAIAPSKSRDSPRLEESNDIIAEEVTFESKLDQILSLAKNTRISAASNSNKEIDNKKSVPKVISSKATAKHAAVDTPSKSSTKSMRKENSVVNSRNKLPPADPSLTSNNITSHHSEKLIPRTHQNENPPKFKSAIVEQLDFLSRNRIYNRFKSHFVANSKLLQVQNFIIDKVSNLHFTSPQTSTLFQLISYLLTQPYLRQLLMKLIVMKSHNKFYMDEIITLIVLQAKPIIQKLSKQALLVKTSLGLDDNMLMEHWLIGQTLLGLASNVLNGNNQRRTNRSTQPTHGLWCELQNALLLSVPIGYMTKNDELSSKVTGRLLVQFISTNIQHIVKLLWNTPLQETLIKLKVVCKDIIRSHSTRDQWEDFLKCIRVLLSIVLGGGKKINCSILYKIAK